MPGLWRTGSPKAGPLASQVLSGSGSRRPSNAEMKGSRYGENLMRGLRKLSIASLPLILLNLGSIRQPLAWDEDLNWEVSEVSLE